MSILKIIDFTQIDPQTEFFLTQFLVNFLVTVSDEVFAACIARIGSGMEKMPVRDGLMVFLKSTLKPKVEDKPALKSKVKKMIKYLDRLGSLDYDQWNVCWNKQNVGVIAVEISIGIIVYSRGTTHHSRIL